jgi:hypothetical protein
LFNLLWPSWISFNHTKELVDKKVENVKFHKLWKGKCSRSLQGSLDAKSKLATSTDDIADLIAIAILNNGYHLQK